jgi:hypothetical protein
MSDKVDGASIFRYARKVADRAERYGKGTKFPTIRHAARRFGMKQSAILDLVEYPDEVAGFDYVGVAVGRGIAGFGTAAHDSIGDYEIEAYRKDDNA